MRGSGVPGGSWSDTELVLPGRTWWVLLRQVAGGTPAGCLAEKQNKQKVTIRTEVSIFNINWSTGGLTACLLYNSQRSTNNHFTWQYLFVARPCRISGIVRSALTLAASSSSSLWGQRAFWKASAEIRAVRMQARLSRRYSQLRNTPTVLSFNRPEVI